MPMQPNKERSSGLSGEAQAKAVKEQTASSAMEESDNSSGSRRLISSIPTLVQPTLDPHTQLFTSELGQDSFSLYPWAD